MRGLFCIKNMLFVLEGGGRSFRQAQNGTFNTASR